MTRCWISGKNAHRAVMMAGDKGILETPLAAFPDSGVNPLCTSQHGQAYRSLTVRSLCFLKHLPFMNKEKQTDTSLIPDCS